MVGPAVKHGGCGASLHDFLTKKGVSSDKATPWPCSWWAVGE